MSIIRYTSGAGHKGVIELSKRDVQLLLCTSTFYEKYKVL